VSLSFRPQGEIFLFVQISQSLCSFEMTKMTFRTASKIFYARDRGVAHTCITRVTELKKENHPEGLRQAR